MPCMPCIRYECHRTELIERGLGWGGVSAIFLWHLQAMDLYDVFNAELIATLCIYMTQIYSFGLC